MNERNQAVALMLLSALSFSLMQAVVKLSATHIGTMEQVFCRNLISMAISFVLLRRSHLPLLGGRKYQPALLARSFCGFIGVVMLFYATAGARQADIAVLNRTSPIWVSLFALLILRGYWLALHARDKFGTLTVVGITTLLAAQVFLNIGVVTNLIPNTGISLPFFSYGGTALMIQLAQMGIILSVSRQIPAPKKD